MTVDTDGILDYCRECGQHASLVQRWDGRFAISCWLCDNQSSWQDTKTDAMLEWNKDQRKNIKEPTK